MGVVHTIDCFGFTEYAVVLHASKAQLSAVRAFRSEIGLRRAMYEAHVTVKGTFRGVEELNAVRRAVENAAGHGCPLAIEFDGTPYEVASGGLLVPVRLSAALEELHTGLEQALERLSDDAYEMPAFSPHLTLCYGCTPEQLTKAQECVAGVRLGRGFTAHSLDLVARTGDPLRGGYCTLIDSFPLGDSHAGRHDELNSFYRSLSPQRHVS